MTREVLQQALDALENNLLMQATKILQKALEQPADAPVLQDIEQYRIQMAGISTAAIGYWKEGEGIHPDYDTPALRDVAALYAKYETLYLRSQPVREWVGLTDEEAARCWTTSTVKTWKNIEQALKEKNT